MQAPVAYAANAAFLAEVYVQVKDGGQQQQSCWGWCVINAPADAQPTALRRLPSLISAELHV